MTNPSWKQFAAIPYDETVAQVIKALDITPPDEGRPRSFFGPGNFMAAITSAGSWLVFKDGASHYIDGPQDIIRIAKLPPGTPSGDALRQWLSWWGWVPPAKKPAPEPQEQTKMIT